MTYLCSAFYLPNLPVCLHIYTAIRIWASCWTTWFWNVSTLCLQSGKTLWQMSKSRCRQWHWSWTSSYTCAEGLSYIRARTGTKLEWIIDRNPLLPFPNTSIFPSFFFTDDISCRFRWSLLHLIHFALLPTLPEKKGERWGRRWLTQKSLGLPWSRDEDLVLVSKWCCNLSHMWKVNACRETSSQRPHLGLK